MQGHLLSLRNITANHLKIVSALARDMRLYFVDAFFEDCVAGTYALGSELVPNLLAFLVMGQAWWRFNNIFSAIVSST